MRYQDQETCNLSITGLWMDKIDRSLMRDLRQDGGKSVSYNCCHLSQVCPGKLAYIQTLLLEDRLRTAGHQPTTILVLYIPCIYNFTIQFIARNILENKKERLCSLASVLILAHRLFCHVWQASAYVWVCVSVWSSGQLCGFTSPCCEGGTIRAHCPVGTAFIQHDRTSLCSSFSILSLLPLSSSFSPFF